jgi:predicted neuraminidase
VTEHYRGNFQLDWELQILSVMVEHTLILHAPHRRAFENRSEHIPLQQAGFVPLQVVAVHDPQWVISVFRFMQLPEQQVGREAEHYRTLLLTAIF